MLTANTAAPCTGLLTSKAQAAAAVTCAAVTVPQLQADLQANRSVAAITQTALRSQIEYRDKLIDQLLPPKSAGMMTDSVWWLTLSVFVSGLAVGAAVTEWTK